MKQFLFLCLMLVSISTRSQEPARFTFDTTIGTGISLNRPAYTPFVWQVESSYHFNSRFSAGIGTGLSLYEKPLLPLFAQGRFNLSKPRRFMPYVGCGIGYSFAVADHSRGGVYWNLMAGVEYKRFTLSLGFEKQNLQRLKRYSGDILSAEYTEKLFHPAIAVKFGYKFAALR